MPIKPENKRRYPDNWNEIRGSILQRAGHKCEKRAELVLACCNQWK